MKRTEKRRILDEYETIDKLKEGYSLARFGDGEYFNIIREAKKISKLQCFDNRLREKLIEVITNPLKKLLIGIPRKEESKKWIWFQRNFFKYISNKPTYKESIFVSAFLTRPSIINKSSDEYFEKIKSIWKDREIILINFNRDLSNHYLFKDCKKIDFICVPRVDCFLIYDNIIETCKNFYKKNKLFLASAGPAATCMAYDLTCDGEQMIDIGQIAFEYSLFKDEKDIVKWTSQNTYKKHKKLR